ncbi:DUF2795 domain-containing protein [Microbacterium sp. M28]|uniref:DUF2795 domain-containing protein n=1 Tax=Microbacterium sp. M28 TaxID=2962064 RepID=UPI0021F41ACE|nr:DUF2795 domain-containing protein [Microbacterium sp. M28]UYO97604.1 DUF2795 domain-containing protein [Microbacterium sp. M28]
MAVSPALDTFLKNMEYPATKDDLLREAVREGLDPRDRAVLDDLPEQSFSARWHIRYHVAQRALADATAPRSLVSA